MKGKVIVMANLKPRPLAGFVSNGMVVCASNADHSKVELLIPEGELGDRLYLEGFEELFSQGDLQPVLNPKKKILEKCAGIDMARIRISYFQSCFSEHNRTMCSYQLSA